MKKKAYISPETEVVTIKIEQLMRFSVTGEGITSDPDPDEDIDISNRSRRRRHRNIWDDDEEECGNPI